jgi:hypothetical protein
MAGHSRLKNGVAPLAYDPAILIHVARCALGIGMPATSAGMTVV